LDLVVVAGEAVRQQFTVGRLGPLDDVDELATQFVQQAHDGVSLVRTVEVLSHRAGRAATKINPPTPGVARFAGGCGGPALLPATLWIHLGAFGSPTWLADGATTWEEAT